jgi:hypothetical protein
VVEAVDGELHGDDQLLSGGRRRRVRMDLPEEFT